MVGSYEYTAELQLEDGTLVPVDLEERGWADPDRLALTRVFTLVPKDASSSWPFFRVHIPEGAKPIFKTRNNVLMTAGRQFRTYAAGYFKDGESHWTWLFPNGAMESGSDDPSIAKLLSAALNDAWREQVRQQQGLAALAAQTSEVENG